MEIMSYLIPFLILITVVVFIHEYGHYYFAKKYGVGVTDFPLVLEKKLLDGKINLGHVGKYVGFH